MTLHLDGGFWKNILFFEFKIKYFCLTQMTEPVDLCSQCNEPAIKYCRCSVGESCCKNAHFWYKDVNGNRVEGRAHDNQLMYENADVCSKCQKPVKYICKCEIGEKRCENGHSWYYNDHGDRFEGSSHK